MKYDQIDWPSKVNLAQLPTPLQRLTRYKINDRSSVWIKRDDLTGFLYSGNKVRKLEYVLGHAVNNGFTRIITCGGMQSNHCRATAFACAQLGLKCHLVLRDVGWNQSGGNFLLDQISGADINCYPASEYQEKLPALLEQWRSYYSEKGEQALIVPTGASDGLGIWGYASAAFELLEDFKANNISPQTVVCATGSGGTQAGLALGFALACVNIKTLGIAVCDDGDYFHRKVARDIEDWQQLNPSITLAQTPNFSTIDHYIGPSYAKPTQHDLIVIRELAQKEGLLLDPVYTAKGFRGLREEIKAGRLEGDIVFIHTGGGFGVFPYEQALLESIA